MKMFIEKSTFWEYVLENILIYPRVLSSKGIAFDNGDYGLHGVWFTVCTLLSQILSQIDSLSFKILLICSYPCLL